MSDPFDIPATLREIVATRALVTALGQALVKKGVISHADVASELSPVIQGLRADDPLATELKIILEAVLGWG